MLPTYGWQVSVSVGLGPAPAPLKRTFVSDAEAFDVDLVAAVLRVCQSPTRANTWVGLPVRALPLTWQWANWREVRSDPCDLACGRKA
jgi:hypothetical protein